MLLLGHIVALSIGFPPRPWGVAAVGLAAPTLFWTVYKCVQRIGARRQALDLAHAPPPPLPDSAPAPDGYASNRRRVPRRAGAVTPIYLLDTLTSGVELAYVLDRSNAGLRLALRRSLIVGIPFRLRASNAPADTPWVEATVRWCNGSNGKYQIGCQFAQTPPVNVLLMLG